MFPFLSQDSLENAKQRLIEYIENDYLHTEDSLLFFMLTNILTESTELLCYGKNNSYQN